MKLSDWRTKEGLTQHEAADKIGISQGHYSELENGTKTPSDDLAAKIEDVTRGSVSFIELKHPKYRNASNA